MNPKGDESVIKIGNLAKICNTSAQTLRYYDTEGVLKADYVDEETGYRFYEPEAVEKYKKIVLYKNLGFSLDEIKDLTSLPADQAQEMMLRKLEVLQNSVQNTQKQISTLEAISRYPGLAAPMINNLFREPFTDDPEVIGRWSFCGILTDEKELTYTVPDEQTYPELCILKELAFLPGGERVWMHCWTKGTVYRYIPKFDFDLPNPYRIITRGGEKYLILQFMSNDCIERALDPDLLLYRQIDSVARTDEQVRKMVDRIDLPFVEDRSVCGEWIAVGFVREIAEFDPVAPCKFELYTLGYRFLPQGQCIKILKGKNKPYEYPLKYTKGAVLNEENITAEAYEIRPIGGREFLFVQHKSGDYVYGGMEPYRYVFIRKE